jgi:glycerol-3-phosphate acyltransferase PlsY
MDINRFLYLLIWITIGYLSGSIPTGYLIGRLKGIDLTEIGSGSTGSTNVLRSLGKGAALTTFVIDILKGFLPLYFAMRLQECTFLVVMVGVFCIIGHSKSIFLGFKGGKSSAVGLGILIALSWKVALITFLIWIIVVAVSKYSSLGSIISIPLASLWMYLFHRPVLYIVLTVFAAVYIVLIRHRENIKRLINGTEPKIGQRQ